MGMEWTSTSSTLPVKVLHPPVYRRLLQHGERDSCSPCCVVSRQKLQRWKLCTCGVRFHRVVRRSKKPLFQDFQGFAEPSKLLPVEEAKFCSELKLEDIPTISNSDMSKLYIVQLFTSMEFGSGLVDSNGAILFCLIDTDGNGILQRISAALTEDLRTSRETLDSQERRFQRGSTDMVIFQGPRMSDVTAAWIGLESGSWRLGNVKVIIVDLDRFSDLVNDSNELQYFGSKYEFEVNDVLLGEGDGTTIIELRPKSVTDFPVASTTTLFSNEPSLVTSMLEQRITNEESMKEYSNLKLSLLIYDAILVSAGTTIFSIAASEKAANAYLLGGIGGFLYLLLLQRSVDGLSASSLTPPENGTKNMMQAFGGFKGPLVKFGLILALFGIVIKYGLENNIVEVTPLEFLIGVLGFFTCRIAVLFAAIKPLGTDEVDM